MVGGDESTAVARTSSIPAEVVSVEVVSVVVSVVLVVVPVVVLAVVRRCRLRLRWCR